MNWNDHVAKWKDCTACPLHTQRSNIVLARGQMPCTVCFVGEAPGASEDAIGQPFVGPAGLLLDNDDPNRPGIVQRALPGHKVWCDVRQGEKIVLDVSVAYTNLVCCFPAEAKARGGNEPEQDEILACRPRLEEFIGLVRPKLVVTVGKLATDYISTPNMVRRVSIVHPASILRMPQAQRHMAAQRSVVVIRSAVEKLLQ